MSYTRPIIAHKEWKFMKSSSHTFEMKNHYTFNTIEHMSKPEQRNLNRMVRAQAANAWRAGLLENTAVALLDLDGPYVFYLYTALPKGHAPDADSGMWIAKRFLDGATDAGIIQDDGPRYLAGTMVIQPVELRIFPIGRSVVYAGLLTNEFTLPEWGIAYD